MLRPILKPIARIGVLVVATLGVQMSAQASRGIEWCGDAQITLSIVNDHNAFAGNAFNYSVNLRNVSHSACIVEGSPLVSVIRVPFAVTVGALVDAEGINPFDDGPVRQVDVKPGQTVRASAVIGTPPNCSATARQGRGRITFSMNLKSISMTVRTCLQEGGVFVYIGPFLPT